MRVTDILEKSYAIARKAWRHFLEAPIERVRPLCLYFATLLFFGMLTSAFPRVDPWDVAWTGAFTAVVTVCYAIHLEHNVRKIPRKLRAGKRRKLRNLKVLGLLVYSIAEAAVVAALLGASYSLVKGLGLLGDATATAAFFYWGCRVLPTRVTGRRRVAPKKGRIERSGEKGEGDGESGAD